MHSDYRAIRTENERKYGTDIGRIGKMLLSDRYDNRTHFIFEVLQNAEDALSKRTSDVTKRVVDFSLSTNALTVSHYGKPFDEKDVRGICGIDESTKDLTSIGRFGIGFKSVFAFTESPEIHSDDEHFAIDSYVWPRAVLSIGLNEGETKIQIPIKKETSTAIDEIQGGLQQLGPRTLLFLREIEEISWSIPERRLSGQYLRERINTSNDNHSYKVIVIGQNSNEEPIEEEWIIFSREIFHDEKDVGHVEIAFSLRKSKDDTSVQPITDSPLVVFFPTVLPTYLGFLVQGPYRTTPSRDNVPANDDWNQHLVQETATLLVETLREMRDYGLLSVSALRCLPLDAQRFRTSRFAPLFLKVRDALVSESLLPRYTGGYISASEAKVADTREIRTLLTPEQLTHLFNSPHEIAWLSEQITPIRTPDLHQYLLEELEIEEISPNDLLGKLTKEFLESQSDEWIEELYLFLEGQQTLLRRSSKRLSTLPLVRIQNGTHVPAYIDGQLQAYLPSELHTDFPTVPARCVASKESRNFLISLGLNVPDPVDDIIVNILPKYRTEQVDIPETEHQADIEQMLAAFETDSRERRDRLIREVKNARIILAVDSADESSCRFISPPEAYQATQRLKALFKGVAEIWIVDDSKDYLRRGSTRDFLNAVGTPEYLIRERTSNSLTEEQKLELRGSTGNQDKTRDLDIEDYTIRGLKPLLEALGALTYEEASQKATLLWDALCDFQIYRGPRMFDACYRWFRYSEKEARFDASFIRILNDNPWVPSINSHILLPSAVAFEDTAWKENIALASLIHFRPAVIDQLAKKAGFEPEALDLLRRRNLTSLADLEELLGSTNDTADANADENAASLREDDQENSSADTTSDGSNTDSSGSVQDGTRQDGPSSEPANRSSDEPESSGTPAELHKTDQLSRPGDFISYVRVHSDEDEEDPDGLTYQARMVLEEKAIILILSEEPKLVRTPMNNPGFDLAEIGPDGEVIKWVEVKAMTGTLHDRPVTVSKTQFECAQENGEAYWLYVVEYAGEPERARILRIQNPAGKARTYTFDHGWIATAETVNAEE